MSTPNRNRTQRPRFRHCIYCSMMLAPNLRRYTVEELYEQMRVLLQTWIVLTNITLDDMIICLECYLLLQEHILLNITERRENMSPAYGHLHICSGCGVFIASRRNHRDQLDSSQTSLILRWTPAYLVSCLERVCIGCWVAATQESQRTVIRDANKSDDVMDSTLNSENTGRSGKPYSRLMLSALML